jgi:phenylpropionate dioxygenase-like ring-hydroxylating dioxygenase large terminal subunit
MPSNIASVAGRQPSRQETRLSDGTSLSDLINLQTREVQLRVLADAEIHELEMERIFGKTWLLLGHESEIPNAGDYVVRDMGADQVIVARARDGQVYVSLNICPHRGMRVCTSEAGNAHVHKCIYHGWAFKPNGDFLGAPVEKEKMHGEILAKDQLGLRKARVRLYGGLFFASWARDGESFEEVLGDM